jgi:hypothetical protein
VTSFINDNGQEIELSEEPLITKQVASFKNFKIKGDVSISFTIPNNSNNRDALGYYGLNQIDSPIFSVNSFNLVKNGNTLMRGNIVIESDSETELSIYFISGNANWFRAFDFSCKDIRNNGYQRRYTYSEIQATAGNTSGIIFPHADWMYGRDKFDRYNFNSRIIEPETGAVGVYSPVNISPCLYVSTLVSELAKIANIRIDGDLLDDVLYKSLIITPDGPDLFNSQGQISTADAGSPTSSAGLNNIIHIEDIAPDMKAIDIIRWICFSFGCVPVFNEFSQTLTLNILDNIKKEDAEDWSEYVKGYTIRYDQYQNNYIRNTQPDDLDTYNSRNDLGYGEVNIQSEKTDGSGIDLYTSPFNPVVDDIGTSPLLWATPYIPFYELEDGEEIDFATVTNEVGKARFDCTVDFNVGGVGAGTNLIVRVEDGIYKGYHNIENANSTSLRSSADFIATSSGTLYVQTVNKVQRGHSILVAVPNYPVSNFTSQSSINVFAVGDVSNVMYAYWAKPFFPYSGLNGKKLGLSYGEIDGIIDINIQERRLNKISKILGNPTVEATMLLPEAVFNSYKFDKFVRLNYKNLSGYFFVDKIQNYRDGQTLVRVDLLYAD